MSSTFSTRPTPKKLAQIRLAIDRAKYGILGSGQPFCQAGSAIGRVVEVERLDRRAAPAAGACRSWAGPARRTRRRRGSGPRRPIEPSPPHPFGPDPGEQAGHAVILVVGPFFERVVVALGAADREPEERLADVLGHILGRLAERVEIGGAVLEALAGGRDDLADEPVPGKAVGDSLANPLIIRLERLGPEPRAVEHQEVGPFVGPVIDELGVASSRSIKASRFVAARIGEEGPGLVHRREPADRCRRRPGGGIRNRCNRAKRAG